MAPAPGAPDGAGGADSSAWSPRSSLTARDAVAAGAVALGEIGAGHTLGGGDASYLYIPAEVERRTGVTITPRQADRLRVAVLGRHISAAAFDPDAVEEALAGADLTVTDPHDLPRVTTVLIGGRIAVRSGRREET